MAIHENLRNLRLAANMTQEQAADMIASKYTPPRGRSESRHIEIKYGMYDSTVEMKQAA